MDASCPAVRSELGGEKMRMLHLRICEALGNPENLIHNARFAGTMHRLSDFHP